MPVRTILAQISMRHTFSLSELTLKHWLTLLLLPIFLALLLSYFIADYLSHNKAAEIGRFNLERLEAILDLSDEVGEFAKDLTEQDCGKLTEYMYFQPYFRGVLLFNANAFYCSSTTGGVNLPLNTLLPANSLQDGAQYIVPETPARPGVPAIITIYKNENTQYGAVVVSEGQYLIDSFIQPDVFPRAVKTVVLGLHGATLPSSPQFSGNQVIRVLAKDQFDVHQDFVILLEISKGLFWHFYWIAFALSLPLIFTLIILSSLLLTKRRGRHSLADDIRSGIENKEFFLVYQPIVGSEDGKAKGVEALVRWQHPQMGLVRPDLFIPIAEESQLIVLLTNYIFERALADFSSMQVEPGFRVGFNVAPEHFIQSDIEAKFRYLRDAFAEIGVQPLIEITERQLLTADMCERIAALRELGILVAIDDFGTGQTTLSLLQTFTLDYLKIDKCFIDTIGQDSVTSHVLDTIIELCHKMNYVAVAEGVETQEQADYLISREVHFLQGYLYAKPMKLDELMQWLKVH